jgi:hypothetical protein
VSDLSGNVFLAGFTDSGAGISSGGHQTSFGGGSYDAYLVKFNSSGIRQWGSYYGGSDSDDGTSCCIDASGNLYLAGTTASTLNIASSGYQNTLGGVNDAFLVKFNSSGTRLWGTYYGGTNYGNGSSCSTDASGNVYLAGHTASTGSIASGGYQNTLAGSDDAFLVKFNGSGVRQWGTYYGGTNYDYSTSCCVNTSGNVYLAGYTESNSSIASGGHQNTFGGGSYDAFLVKLCENPSQPSIISGTTVTCLGGVLSFSVINDLSATSYSWNYSGSGSGTSTTNSIVFSPIASGTLFVAAINSCAASLTQSLIILVSPSPIISANSGSICNGQSYTITPSGATTYSYSGGSNIVSPNTTSQYSVTGTNVNGCVTSSAAIVTVTVYSLPTLTLTSINSTICAGETNTLTVSGANTFTWNNSSTGANIIVNPFVTTIYSVTGEDSKGCRSTSTITLNVNSCTGIKSLATNNEYYLIYPNPNCGEFFIESLHITDIKVYNSLGQIILQQNLLEGKNKIDMINQAKGIYVIQMNQNGNINTSKIIKE